MPTTFSPMQDGIGFAYQGHKIVIGLAEEDDAVTGMTSIRLCAAVHPCHITWNACKQCMQRLLQGRRPAAARTNLSADLSHVPDGHHRASSQHQQHLKWCARAL